MFSSTQGLYLTKTHCENDFPRWSRRPKSGVLAPELRETVRKETLLASEGGSRGRLGALPSSVETENTHEGTVHIFLRLCFVRYLSVVNDMKQHEAKPPTAVNQDSSKTHFSHLKKGMLHLKQQYVTLTATHGFKKHN